MAPAVRPATNCRDITRKTMTMGKLEITTLAKTRPHSVEYVLMTQTMPVGDVWSWTSNEDRHRGKARTLERPYELRQ
jgi:hypothetical protein